MEKEKVDEEFVETMLEIEKSYSSMNKHEKVRIEQWSKKLCQVTANPLWKKNRNKYAKSLLQLVKIGALQEPFTKIPPEGPLPQFNGQLYIQPPKPRPKSSAGNRISSNSDSSKQLKIKFDPNISDTPSFEKPGILKANSNKALEPSNKSSTDRYDTRIQITSKVNEDCIRLQTQIEIFQINEKHLRDELSKRNKKIQDQAEQIEMLLKENESLKAKLASCEKNKKGKELKESFEEVRTPYRYFLEKKKSEDELLNIDDISNNLKRLEKLQEDLNRNKFG